MTNEFNILLTSAGPRVDRVRMVRRALEELNLQGRVVAVDLCASRSAACQMADAAFDVPAASDAQFVPALLEICLEQNVRVVFPTIDADLPALASSRDQLDAAGITAIVSSPGTVNIATDKVATHRWLTEHEFPTVAQATPEEITHSDDLWSYPLLVKPRAGCSSAGVHIVRDQQELDQTTHKKDVLVQTIAPGVEYTVDTLVNREGRCLCAVPRQRIAVRAGEVFKGVTIRNARLQSVASSISEKLPGAYGPLNIQMFLDEKTGQLNVIEINARLGGGFHLAWQAGAHFPRWILEEILGRPSTASADDWQDGLMMLRYLEAVFIETDEKRIPPH